jgi:hypothetical protein
MASDPVHPGERVSVCNGKCGAALHRLGRKIKRNIRVMDDMKGLGHSSISTTATYLDHIAPGRVISMMKERKW